LLLYRAVIVVAPDDPEQLATGEAALDHRHAGTGGERRQDVAGDAGQDAVQRRRHQTPPLDGEDVAETLTVVSATRVAAVEGVVRGAETTWRT